jgi:Skp family chaperone for outer membrane proteins
MPYKKLIAGLLTLLLISPPSPKPAQAQVQAVAAVVGVGVQIAKYFADANKADELKAISKQLAEIQSKLDDMDKKLDEVLSELRAMKIKFDEIPDMESRKRVSALTAVIVKDFSTWAANPKKYSTEIHQTSLNLEIETANLMSRKSYGNFETVAFAMYLQRSMFLLIKADATLQREHYAAFEDYFKGALSPEIDGSVGREKKITDARLSDITSYLSPGVPFYCQVSGWFHHCCGVGLMCDYYNFQDVQGGMSEGYRLVGTPYEVKIAGPGNHGWCAHQGDPNHGHGLSLEKNEMAEPGAGDQDKLAKLWESKTISKAPESSGAQPMAVESTNLGTEPMVGIAASSDYFEGLSAGVAPGVSPDLYGRPGVAACPVQLNPLKTERDALILKSGALRDALSMAATFEGIATKLKNETRLEMNLSE